ncbi:MAG: type II toxin-antitoxin system HicA family toxin [Candidatus Eremiobacteraeota bacterium]|nr:type II toxin-antitoxin system HicA family toxin [Candidatus Eremiobacteraeota bacterium]MBC5802016.1 type II toxin-antitoxin system HicA family toxin [Candidatus Eremiobacteraeota bacterium]MBC5822580.1 type II toxin-antitoxin system HicA family toxin [Candidatus Eremiobacteraeota bacterium]
MKKNREIIREPKQDGWYQLPGGKTGHRQFKHPSKLGRVTVSGSLGDDMPIALVKSVEKQSGLKLT